MAGALRTLRDLRRAVGYEIAGTQSASAFSIQRVGAGSTASTLTVPSLSGGAGYVGYYVVVAGERRRVTLVKDGPPVELALDFPLRSAATDGDEFELWDQDRDPARFASSFNSAIAAAGERGVFSAAFTDEAWIEPDASRLPAPDGWTALSSVEYIADGYQAWALSVSKQLLKADGVNLAEGVFKDLNAMFVPTGAIIDFDLVDAAANPPALAYDHLALIFWAEEAGKIGARSGDSPFRAGWNFKKIPRSLQETRANLYTEGGGSVFVFDIALVDEKALTWKKWFNWRAIAGSGFVELGCSWPLGTRLRLTGGKPLPPLVDDDDVLDEALDTEFVIADALVRLLRAYDRNAPEPSHLSRDWEITARISQQKLKRLQNAKRL